MEEFEKEIRKIVARTLDAHNVFEKSVWNKAVDAVVQLIREYEDMGWSASETLVAEILKLKK